MKLQLRDRVGKWVLQYISDVQYILIIVLTACIYEPFYLVD